MILPIILCLWSYFLKGTHPPGIVIFLITIVLGIFQDIGIFVYLVNKAEASK